MIVFTSGVHSTPGVGSWTDYIFAGGKKIALAPGEEHFLQTSGQASGYWAMLRWNLPTPVDPSGTAYTVKAGDRLCFRQYNSGGAVGGPWLMFSNGVSTIWNWTTPDGQWLSDSFGPQNQWATCCIDLTGAYDAAGNVANDGLDKYLYDGEGRLCAVQNGSGAMTGYIYDGSGERVAKGGISAWSCDQTTNGFSATSNYIYGANSQQLAEYSGTGALLHESVLGNGALLASSIQSAGAWLYAFNDWLGTKRAQISPDGADNFLGFDSLPYGDIVSLPDTSTGANEDHFTGKERDAESGLDYFGARYYASNMGRWMSPDYSEGPDTVPYALWSDPQTLNLYSYVRNNPLRSLDPDGHASYQPCNGGTQQCFQGDYDGEVYCKTSTGCIQWNAKSGEWGQYIQHFAPDGIKPDLFPLDWIVGGKVADAAIGTIGGLFGRGAAKVGEGMAAKGAEEAASSIFSKQPAWAKTPGGFVNWLKNLSHEGVQLSKADADAVIAQAKQLNVDVRLDPPHPGTNWEVPHLNIGQEGQVHLEVPSGYDNPGVPKGSATKPR